jgi:hypothetical protein
MAKLQSILSSLGQQLTAGPGPSATALAGADLGSSLASSALTTPGDSPTGSPAAGAGSSGAWAAAAMGPAGAGPARQAGAGARYQLPASAASVYVSRPAQPSPGPRPAPSAISSNAAPGVGRSGAPPPHEGGIFASPRSGGAGGGAGARAGPSKSAINLKALMQASASASDSEQQGPAGLPGYPVRGGRCRCLNGRCRRRLLPPRPRALPGAAVACSAGAAHELAERLGAAPCCRCATSSAPSATRRPRPRQQLRPCARPSAAAGPSRRWGPGERTARGSALAPCALLGPYAPRPGNHLPGTSSCPPSCPPCPCSTSQAQVLAALAAHQPKLFLCAVCHALGHGPGPGPGPGAAAGLGAQGLTFPGPGRRLSGQGHHNGVQVRGTGCGLRAVAAGWLGPRCSRNRHSGAPGAPPTRTPQAHPPPLPALQGTA